MPKSLVRLRPHRILVAWRVNLKKESVEPEALYGSIYGAEQVIGLLTVRVEGAEIPIYRFIYQLN